MNAGNSDLQNLRSYSYVLVARCLLPPTEI